MSSSLWDMTLSEFCERTASTASTPGGGSVTMVSASLGLALVIMALEISARKEKAQDKASKIKLLSDAAHDLLPRLKAHADEDVVAFQRYMEAIGLPKETDDQKAIRKKAMDAALEKATLVPLSAAQDTLKGIELAVVAAELTATNVISDVGAGTVMMEAGLRGALLNVTINLPFLSDPSLVESLSAQRDEYYKIAGERASFVSQSVEARIARR